MIKLYEEAIDKVIAKMKDASTFELSELTENLLYLDRVLEALNRAQARKIKWRVGL